MQKTNTASSYGVLFFVVKHISITLTLKTRHQSHNIENEKELRRINHFLHLLWIKSKVPEELCFLLPSYIRYTLQHILLRYLVILCSKILSNYWQDCSQILCIFQPTIPHLPNRTTSSNQTSLRNVNAVARAAHDRVKPAGPLPPAATTSTVAMFTLRSVWQHNRLKHSLPSWIRALPLDLTQLCFLQKALMIEGKNTYEYDMWKAGYYISVLSNKPTIRLYPI